MGLLALLASVHCYVFVTPAVVLAGAPAAPETSYCVRSTDFGRVEGEGGLWLVVCLWYSASNHDVAVVLVELTLFAKVEVV